MEKKCTKCKVEKDIDEYHKLKSSKDGKHSWCKVCVSESKKKHYTDNIKDYKRRKHNSYSKHRDKRKQYAKEN